ncbi:hypothetical protein BGX21_008543 [Mortierella sp. AD011]|nr:hypothetical protein BGX20_005234 [Mortierella sp. AD010]KAF9402823.1 hypothetical protein BGX21_008543 [Mortierella sp. AD011]
MATTSLPAPFLTISTQEQSSPSPPCSPTVGSDSISPRVSPVLSSPPHSPRLNAPCGDSSSTNHQQSHPNHLEERLRSSFAQHQEYQKQMRLRLLQSDHPLHHPSPESAQRHYQQLASQLEYYRQLQIMHCQRVRDVELLHQQQQQLQQQQPQPFHVIKRFQIAQRMLQMQKLYHAQQIQKIQYLQKISRLQGMPSNSNQAEATPVKTADNLTEEDIVKLEIDPNTIHIPVRVASRPRLDLQEILGTARDAPLLSPTKSGIQELARIVLPSPGQIRKLRRQRLKHQARLRQAITESKAKSLRSRKATDMIGSSQMTHLKSTPASPTIDGVQLEKQVQAKVWTSSTTSVVSRSTADLQYRRQLRHSMALQQHMIQDHTHRYRIFQAFCLLQRAREAQALDEVEAQKRKQLQTLAWVEALRQSKELEIPQ